MTTTPEQLLENFKNQQAQVMEEIRKLDVELAQRRELFVKLQGAIEGMQILSPEEQSAAVEPEVVTEPAESVE